MELQARKGRRLDLLAVSLSKTAGVRAGVREIHVAFMLHGAAGSEVKTAEFCESGCNTMRQANRSGLACVHSVRH